MRLRRWKVSEGGCPLSVRRWFQSEDQQPFNFYLYIYIHYFCGLCQIIIIIIIIFQSSKGKKLGCFFFFFDGEVVGCDDEQYSRVDSSMEVDRTRILAGAKTYGWICVRRRSEDLVSHSSFACVPSDVFCSHGGCPVISVLDNRSEPYRVNTQFPPFFWFLLIS